MKLKDKIKVFALTAVGGVLAYCGFNKQEKGDGGISRNSVEWTVNPEQLALGKCDTILFEPEKIAEVAEYEEKDDKEQAHYTTIPSHIKEDISKALEKKNAKKISARLARALQQQNIVIEKEDSLLRSVDYKDGKFSNPVYEITPKEEKQASSIEKVGGAEIKRNGGKTVVTTLDPSTIAISSEKEASYKEHFYKLRKVIEDRNVEKGLHKGDTVNYKQEIFVDGDDFVIEEKQAIVEKDGISPTYKEDNVKEHKMLKLNFNYAHKQVEK